MPWPPKQMRAIAARMRAEGKSREEIGAFFRRHGTVSASHPMRKRPKRK